MEEKKLSYAPEVTKALEIAQKIARENMNARYSGGHLLKAVLNRDLPLLKLLESKGVDVFYLEEWAEVRIEEALKATNTYSCDPDEVIDTIFTEAEAIREILDEEEISLWDVFVALSTQGVAFNFDQMKTYPVTRAELLETTPLPATSAEKPFSSAPLSSTAKGFLQKYCVNKKDVLKAKASKEIPVGRVAETQKITEILCRFSKQNVLIIGDSGIGKTTLINSFVQKVIAGQVPDVLSNLAVFELDMGALIAGASYKGEIEDRIKNIAQELKQYPKSVLIIEELHALLANSFDSSMANLLKSELTKGLTVIGTSTIDEFTKKIEKSGLEPLFEKVELQESDDETHFRMLRQTLSAYENHHHIAITDEAIWEAIRLSKRYLKEKSLPASAIDLIDHTMSVVKTAGASFLKEKNALLTQIIHLEDNTQGFTEEQRKKNAAWLLNDIKQRIPFLLDASTLLEEEQTTTFETADNLLSYGRKLITEAEKVAQEKRSHITEWDLAVLISQKTNIPIGKLKEEEKQRLSDMDAILSERVVGQDHAIAIISEAVLENRSGLSKAGQPIGSFFFLGPTGTGKTELAKSLAEFLFQDENAIIRFDMSEFKEEHSAALLYGAPPGYVGYEEGGLLVTKIRQKPYSVVLFDEIEKAHSSVYDVFLQMMDEGKIHDKLGREGDFSNSIIIFTSNIGSQWITQQIQAGHMPTSNELIEVMSKYFRPEFLGRLTEVVPFSPISESVAQEIFKLHFSRLQKQLSEQKNISIELSPETLSYLTAKGYSPQYGARPIAGVIRMYLKKSISKLIVSEAIKDGDSVIVNLKDGNLLWEPM